MLSVKHLNINSFGENIAYINKNCSSYKVDDISKNIRLEIQGHNKTIYAFLQIVDDENIINVDEIGLNNDAYSSLNMPEGQKVSVNIAPLCSSLSYIKRKISGDILSSAEYAEIMQDIAAGKYSKIEMTAFLVACSSFMSSTELVALTESFVSNKVIYWDENPIIVDQHSLGGVCGNKTDLVVLAIVSAYGLPIAKTCIHSLTSCSGVADTMGVMANINFDENKFQEYVKANNGSIVCYDSLHISKANRLLHSVRRQLGLNQPEFVIASILAMMMSGGVNHLVLDIPVGKKVRIKTTNEAIRIRKQIEYVGDMLGLEIDVVITDGSEPIGNGVGAVLEARDVMQILRNKPEAPQDLREKSLFLAGRVLEFDPNLRGGQGYSTAKEILESGRALTAFEKIIKTQGAKDVPQLDGYHRDVVAPYSGTVEAIDNSVINKIGMYAGATQCMGSGIDLNKKVGDNVNAGEVLYTIYSCNNNDFDVACTIIENNNGYSIKVD